MNEELEKTEVIVAPGKSFREPGKVHRAMVRTPDGSTEERVVDVELRVVLPGEKIMVFTKDVPTLIAMRCILDPATNELAPYSASVPGLSK